MRRRFWPVAAIVAFVFLTTLALTGGRGGPGLAPFRPGGLLTISPQDVREIAIVGAGGGRRFVRTADGWRAAQGEGAAVPASHIETALKLLHNAGPERVLSESELQESDPAQYGLEPPRLRVTVRSASLTQSVSFGAANVLGLSHFARREGSREIALIPGYVAEEWERVGNAP